jgi:hypothetical protein
MRTVRRYESNYDLADTLDSSGMRGVPAEYVPTVYAVAKRHGLLIPAASDRADGVSFVDPNDFSTLGPGGGAPMLRLDASDEDEDDEDDTKDAQACMVQRQKDAWKPGNRHRDRKRADAGIASETRPKRPGRVADPESAPFVGSSRETHGAGQSAMNSQMHEPRERGGSLAAPESFGAEIDEPFDRSFSVGAPEDIDRLIARQKDAWKPENRRPGGKRRSAVMPPDGAFGGGQ